MDQKQVLEIAQGLSTLGRALAPEEDAREIHQSVSAENREKAIHDARLSPEVVAFVGGVIALNELYPGASFARAVTDAIGRAARVMPANERGVVELSTIRAATEEEMYLGIGDATLKLLGVMFGGPDPQDR